MTEDEALDRAVALWKQADQHSDKADGLYRDADNESKMSEDLEEEAEALWRPIADAHPEWVDDLRMGKDPALMTEEETMDAGALLALNELVEELPVDWLGTGWDSDAANREAAEWQKRWDAALAAAREPVAPAEARVDLFATALQEGQSITVFPGDEDAAIAAAHAIGLDSFTLAAREPVAPAAPVEREHDPEFWADCAEGRCPHVAPAEAEARAAQDAYDASLPDDDGLLKPPVAPAEAETGRPPLDPAVKASDDTYMAGLIRGRELEREAAALAQPPAPASAETARWIDSLHEDHNGIVWTTKAELRQWLAAAREPVAPAEAAEAARKARNHARSVATEDTSGGYREIRGCKCEVCAALAQPPAPASEDGYDEKVLADYGLRPDGSPATPEATADAALLCEAQHSYHPSTDSGGPCYLCRELARRVAAIRGTTETLDLRAMKSAVRQVRASSRLFLQRNLAEALIDAYVAALRGQPSEPAS